MKKGITLIETVVAVTVLTLALGGPFLLAAQSLRSAAYAREEVTAARLAEEGLEIVHSIRDNNAGEDQSKWNQYLSSCFNGCIVDIRKKVDGTVSDSSIWGGGAIVGCSGPCLLSSSATQLYKHQSGLLYAQGPAASFNSSWEPTAMNRVITITERVSGREYDVKSAVSYRAGNAIKTVELYDTIMHWFPLFDDIKGT